MFLRALIVREDLKLFRMSLAEGETLQWETLTEQFQLHFRLAWSLGPAENPRLSSEADFSHLRK